MGGTYWKDERGRYPDLATAYFVATAFLLALAVFLWLVLVVWR